MQTSKEQKLARVIEIINESMLSHLEDCYDPIKVPKKMKDAYGNQNFHKKCVKEYTEAMYLLSQLL